jgi:2-polyprenyl-6-methoxyphenol hydroxylase-like FAD-dependent oxidoreductase
MNQGIPDECDVLIVGGRPAGSTLAARLGQQGLRVLLIERAAMPSPPAASMPIIYASTMALLDEIGAAEAEYAAQTPKIRRMANVTPDMRISLPLPEVRGRDYAYAIDRARFDGALWTHAARCETVTAVDRASFLDMWRDDDRRVIGAVVQPAGGPPVQVRAALVVGADGRFSAVARRAGAAERDVREDNPTSLLYAYWDGVAPFDEHGPAAVAYGEGGGLGYLLMDSADGSVAVGIEGQAELLEAPAGGAEAFYRGLLDRIPEIRARLADATMRTGVHGMRRVGNLYRQAGGQGWALVGDAYHQKDPIDGQGVYDAVFTARALAEAIGRWRAGADWDAALEGYDAAARAVTYPMYQATLERVRTSLYTEAPAWFSRAAGRTLFRWLFEDPLCQQQLGLMLTRELAPNEMMSAPVVVGALLKGPLRDLSRFLERRIQNAS